MNVFGRYLKNARRLLFLLIVGPLLLIIGGSQWIVHQASDQVYETVEALPVHDVGLVLGTSKYTRSGRTNLHFESRMDAAAALYKAGRIRHILASGDHQHEDYDETAFMREALLARGVPLEAITFDRAGLRTLDSVIRAHEVFGLERFVVISQEYHIYRAIFIGRHHGLDVSGFCAEPVPFKHSIKTELRERLARIKALIDLYILDERPKILGEKRVIRLEE